MQLLFTVVTVKVATRSRVLYKGCGAPLGNLVRYVLYLFSFDILTRTQEKSCMTKKTACDIIYCLLCLYSYSCSVIPHSHSQVISILPTSRSGSKSANPVGVKSRFVRSQSAQLSVTVTTVLLSLSE